MNIEEKVLLVLKKVLFLSSTTSKNKITKDNTEEWDSLKHIIIITELEELFNIQFSPEEIVQMKNSDIIINIVKQKINRKLK